MGAPDLPPLTADERALLERTVFTDLSERELLLLAHARRRVALTASEYDLIFRFRRLTLDQAQQAGVDRGQAGGDELQRVGDAVGVVVGRGNEARNVVGHGKGSVDDGCGDLSTVAKTGPGGKPGPAGAL
jgi:hypothetical protein